MLRFCDSLRLRLAREPIARILGEKEFWGLTFRLNAHAFVPRPETETVVEAALTELNHAKGKTLRIADLGTGSGALLLALLSELPKASGIGTDIDVCALESARANALTQGARASFIACDYGSALKADFDLVVSNPPYIRTAEITGLAPEVRQFEPKTALDGGTDGLDGSKLRGSQTGPCPCDLRLPSPRATTRSLLRLRPS